MPKNNREFNFGQPAKTPPVSRVFNQAEIGLPFKCDVHGWMNAYVNVVPHPFFAVTKDDGSFEIKGLPAGSYTLELWHERLGTQTLPVTVDARGARQGQRVVQAGELAAKQRIIPRALPITRKGVAMKIVNAVMLGLCTVIAAACGGAETPPASTTASAPAAAPASPPATSLFRDAEQRRHHQADVDHRVRQQRRDGRRRAARRTEARAGSRRARFTTTSPSTPIAWRPARQSRRPTRGSTLATARK